MSDNSNRDVAHADVELPPPVWDEDSWQALTGFETPTGDPDAETGPEPHGYALWLAHPEPSAPANDVSGAGAGEAPKVSRARMFGARLILAITCVAIIGGLIGLAVWLVPTTQSSPPARVPVAAPPPSSATISTSVPATDPSWCRTENGPQRISGNGKGSPASAPEVILALEYAYYVDRAADAVRRLLAPDGRFGADAEIQAGIDAVPAGTKHCVSITAAGIDRWAVVLTEKRPDGSTVVHAQTISTTQREDRALIVAVETA
ncbi:hypothetical protein [Nocardia sp. NPDC050710]|uniref:hypothetical protein n=1 Tax=Nocardia sp. NPDC050710 TaxID=3157220 RepID=UPI00340DFF76